MRPGGGDAQADALGALRQLATDPADLVFEFRDVAADSRADFDDRLVQLALDLIAERGGASGQQLRDVRAQRAGVGLDELELFREADREGVGPQ
jgi:hypothetical protein